MLDIVLLIVYNERILRTCMKVIPPITITPAMLTSSSIAEPDTTVGEASWVSGTTYPTVGTIVILTSTHRKYYKLNTNVSTNLTVAPNINTADWLDVGPTNKWAMFDNTRTAGSTSTSTVTISIAPGVRANSIALVGCTANYVNISVSSGGPVIYTYATSMVTRHTTGWYKYFYGSFEYKASVITFAVPPNLNNIITITFSMPTGGGVIGSVILGNYIALGDIQKQPVLEATNFSKIDRDAYGNSLLVPRRSVPKTSQRTFTTKSNVNKLMAARDLLNAVPAIWVGVEDPNDLYFEPLLIMGVYKEFSISMDYPDHAIVSLQLEEM